MLPEFAHRRLFGLFFGGLVGFTYSLATQGINHLMIPGVPLYHPPLGFWGNLLAATGFCSILGVLTAWPRQTYWGVLWSSLLGALVLITISLMNENQGQDWWVQFGSLVLLFMPVTGACAILTLLFRWVVNREMDARWDGARWSRKRITVPAIMLLLTAFTGFFFLYPPAGRTVTVRMNEMILEGQKAISQDAIPAPFRSKEVTRFAEMSHSGYELEWDSDPNNRYRVARRLTDPYNPTTVVARFDNGWMLVCVFSNEVEAPSCRDF
jgi:hypothetical protein